MFIIEKLFLTPAHDALRRNKGVPENAEATLVEESFRQIIIILITLLDFRTKQLIFMTFMLSPVVSLAAEAGGLSLESWSGSVCRIVSLFCTSEQKVLRNKLQLETSQ